MFQNQNIKSNEVADVAASILIDGAQHQHQQENINYNEAQQLNQNKGVRKKPFVKITEQPATKALRFRYECEGRSAGSIPGINSTPENKTYPTIEIVGYKGRAVVVVSCVTKDQPYRPHPHNLVGKEGCKKGVCTLEINSETMRAVFSNLGIQCVKKKDIETALKAREDIRVDPFKTGFSHRFQPSSIDLNVVRLCFQVFMESEHKGRFTQPLPPVVSDPIYDKKAMSDLVICRLCSCSASVLGNTQIILLCEKVAKEDIAVRFFEEKNNQIVWEAYGEFQHTDVHKQTAITFKTPRYHTVDITEPAKVFIQLRRPSDGMTSEALHFEYIPLDSDPAHLKRKRQKTGGHAVQFLLQNQHKQAREHNDGHLNVPIKTEPGDTSPQPYATYPAPTDPSSSPQSQSPSYNYNAAVNANYNIVHNSTQPMLSPNPHSYNQVGFHNTPSPMHAGFGVYGQAQPEVLSHRQPLQQQLQEPQRLFLSNNFNNSPTIPWQEGFPGTTNNSNMNMVNIGQTGTANAHIPDDRQSDGLQLWNVAPTHTDQPMQHLQDQLQQHTHQQVQVNLQYIHPETNKNDNGASLDTPMNTELTSCRTSQANNNSTNENGPTISNLLSLDSEQYMRINSDELQQISCLSIST